MNVSFRIRRVLRSRHVILLAAIGVAASNVLANELFNGDLQLASANKEGEQSVPTRQTYLLPYHEQDWPNKYLEWLWKDPINLITRPVYWRGGEWTTFGIEAGITGALIPLDEPFRDLVQDNRSKTVDSAPSSHHS